MNRVRAFIASVLLLLASSAFCQSGAVFAPFVSRLKAEAADTKIKLTWKDSSDAKGDCLVYRYTEEITDANLIKAVLISTVAAGVEFCIDSPPDQKGYYYAVLVQDAQKKLFRLFIPFRNITSTAVAIATTSTEEDLATKITGIRATVAASGDAVTLSFQSSKPARDLLVFWGTAPIAGAEDLLRGASKAGINPGVTMYRIPVVRGVDYFFAVLDAGLFKVGKAPLVPGQNTTTSPLQIPLQVSIAATPSSMVRRALPLPTLQLAEAMGSGLAIPEENAFRLPEQTPVSQATNQAIGEIMKGIDGGQGSQMSLEILEDDRTPAAGGELSSLQTIVSGQFGKAGFAEVERLIRDFLSVERSPKVEARARFYLGQVMLFQKKPREAAMEFIIAQDYFYHETQPWLDECLREIDSAS